MKTKSGTDLRQVLETLRSETQPIDGHPDPEAIADCWAEVFETLFPPTLKVPFAPCDLVTHVDYPEFGVGEVQEIAKSKLRAKVHFPNYDRRRIMWEPRGYYTFAKLRHAPKEGTR